jgi:uncharacterized protein YbjT (DUF2867 family)
VDVNTGVGLMEALNGVDAVVDATNTTTLFARTARRFFESATRNLLEAERINGVGHHVVPSVVGIDAIDASYYAGKLAQERAVAAGPIPYTIARAGQFHEYVAQLVVGMKGPIVVLPKTLSRPVAAREVGAHLVTVTEAGPTGRATDLVGPRDERLAELARRMLAYDRVTGRRVLELRLPGSFGRGLASGALRGNAPRLEADMTFDSWLESDDHRRPL